MKRLLLTVVLFVAALLNATEIPKPTAATLPTYPEEYIGYLGGTVNWHSFVEKQTHYCAEHPAGSAISTVFFGFIVGMRVSGFSFRQHSVSTGECAFVAVFVILAIWQTYLLSRALRTTRDQTD